MTEKSRVLAVSGDLVTVQQDVSGACFGCMNQECQKNQWIITAQNSTGLPLTVGQEVTTEFPFKSALGQAAFLLLLPLLGFALVYAASGLLFPALNEAARAACGVPALFAVAFALYCYRRKRPARGLCQVIGNPPQWG
jgi:sigma-E factor negative regulatory protein RseC